LQYSAFMTLFHQSVLGQTQEVVFSHFPRPEVTSRAERPLRRNLRATVADGLAAGVMTGMGETYLPAFVLALGMGEIAAGLITTVPLLLGSLLQLATPSAMRWLRSRRLWVVACSRLQAISLLLLVVVPLAGVHRMWLVFLAASLYWGLGLASSPVWNTWMEDLVPQRIRARFLARRVRICQAAIMGGFVVGGLLLQATSGGPWLLWTFALLFALSSACRGLSSRYLASQSDTPSDERITAEVGLLRTLMQLRHTPDSRLLVYFIAVQVAVYTSGPYFAPYMLSELQFTYFHYMLLVALGYLGKVLTLPAWGRLAARFGTHRLLFVGALGIIPVSGLWLFGTSFWYLVAVQLIAGALWAPYELAMAILFLEAVPRQQRTSLLTLYNFGNSAAMVTGGLLGASVLAALGATPASYLVLFGLSSVARALTLGLLFRVPGILTGRSAMVVSGSPGAKTWLNSFRLTIEARVLTVLRSRRIDGRLVGWGTPHASAIPAPVAAVAGIGTDARSQRVGSAVNPAASN